ncbi:MAG: 2-dehydro-3-deoxy-D-gluconate 5-dehydrogenase KduD [Bacteroidetes bacterium]|nr:2-dehydro-3-deoxy-D-gluconate 5-dehydrogenase KduD [Bacteroidota bacterium]
MSAENYPLFSLHGKTAVITGASTGLGRGMAVALARAGADCVLVSRSVPDDTVNEITALGRNVHVVQADVAERESTERIITGAMQAFGRIDILVNNAGIIRRNDALEFTEQEWDDVMDVNVRSAFFLSQAAAKQMIVQGKGKIINIASLLSFQGGIRVPSYAASKGAIVQVTKAMANEFASKGINTNAIAPGYMVTNNTDEIRNDEGRHSAITSRIPMGRWGTPEDLSGAVIFLASSASDYVNGHVLVVDGGWLAR